MKIDISTHDAVIELALKCIMMTYFNAGSVHRQHQLCLIKLAIVLISFICWWNAFLNSRAMQLKYQAKDLKEVVLQILPIAEWWPYLYI